MSTTTLEGRNVVLEALRRGRKIFEVKIDSKAQGAKIDSVVRMAEKNGIAVQFVSRKDLDRVSKTKSHQGVIAFAEKAGTVSLKEVLSSNKEPFLIVLAEVLYEHNLGAVLRTAGAVGAHAVVIPPAKGVAMGPVVERVSMGASNIVPVITEGIHSALSKIKKAGIQIVGVEVSGSVDFFDANLSGPVALVFGGEDSALSLPMMEKCDIVVRIPMRNSVQSLNQSVSVGILAFEKIRQDLKNG